MSLPVAGNARLLILGDDLSGTADCAVKCTSHGLGSAVFLNAATTFDDMVSTDVLAIDTDTRRASATDAAGANERAWRMHGTGRRLYKKIDSTLRGNVASEVAALAIHAGMGIVAPAFPEAGRSTRNGSLEVHGVPVEATEIWRNEGIGGTGHLPSMLAGVGLQVAHVTLQAVREGVTPLRARLEALRAAKCEAVVCDSETDADLVVLAQASATLDGVFWVGSAGFAQTLISALTDENGPQTVTPEAGIAPATIVQHPRGVLAVVGSMSSVSHEQVATLRAGIGDTGDAFDVDVISLLEPMSSESLDLSARIACSLMLGRHAVVALSQTMRGPVADGERLAHRLAECLAPAAAHAAALIATGGETARALLAAMGIERLRVVEEVEPGVPLMAAAQAERLLPVVTKAGGFGRPDTLYRAWQRLAAMTQADANAPRQPSKRKP